MINSIVVAVREVFRQGKQGAPTRTGMRFQARLFMSIIASCIVLFLVMQSTVRLEVERTWHWAFIPGWTLGGICLVSAAVSVGRLLRKPRAAMSAMTIIGWTQLAVTVALAISIQDYY